MEAAPARKHQCAALQNPGSYQVEVSKARMAISAAAPLTWGHFTHLWNDAIEADKGTLHMLETAFPVRCCHPTMQHKRLTRAQ